MTEPHISPYRHGWLLALLVLVLSGGAFLMDGNVGISFADEGYLWGGVEALKSGAVPIRDFHAYDPGRYGWLAGWSYLLGDGLVSLRMGCALFACIGVWCGLLAASRISRDWKFLLLVALTLSQWMQPRYKVFEQAISLMAIYVAVRLIERPTLRQHALTGAFVGLMAFFGRNHGVYLLGAFGLMMLFLARGEWARLPGRLLTLGGGIVFGYLPQLAMLAFVPGYLGAYVRQLHTDLAVGTNLATSVRWPWRISAESLGLHWWSAFSEGCFYLALPIGLLVLAVVLLRCPRPALLRDPVLLAAGCVTLTYAHHTFSRADYVHLAHSAPAFALAIVALAAAFGERTWMPHLVAGVLFAASTLAITPKAEFVMEMREPVGGFRPLKIRGQTMHVHLQSAVLLRLANRVAHELAKPGEGVAFLPHWPGLYPATGSVSPFYQTYFILPATAAEEEVTLAAMGSRHVTWIMLQDSELDGRSDLRFRNTNPRTFAYLQRHFRRVEMPNFPPMATILRRIEPPVTAAH